MFENGIIKFNLKVYFQDNSFLTIGSEAIVSLGDIVSQIADDDPISKSNDFEIEILDHVLMVDLSVLIKKPIKNIECFGNWICKNIIYLDGKYILTCSGTLQNTHDVAYTPASFGDVNRYILNILQHILPENSVITDATTEYLTENQRGQKVVEQQNILQYIATPTGEVFAGSGWYDDIFQDFSLSFTADFPYLLKTANYSPSLRLNIEYYKYLCACGNTILYSNNGNIPLYTILLQFLLAQPDDWRTLYQGIKNIGSDKPTCIQFNQTVYHDITGTYVSLGDLTAAQCDFAEKNFDTFARLVGDFAPENIMTYYSKIAENCKLDAALHPWPVENAIVNDNRIHNIMLQCFSVKDGVYTLDHLKQCLAMCNYVLLESTKDNDISLLQKSETFNNITDFVLDSNNINDLQITNEVFNLYDGQKINISYLDSVTGENKNFDFIQENCYWPQKIATDLLNGAINGKVYYTNASLDQNYMPYLRLQSFSYVNFVNNNNNLEWEVTSPITLTDSANNLYTASNIQGYNTNLDQLNNNVGGYCNKNQNIIDGRAQTEIYKISLDRRPETEAILTHDLIDVSGVKDGVADLFDIGPHQVYQCRTNLDVGKIKAGQICILKNINSFGNIQNIYKIFIVNKSLQVFNGTCILKFIILNDYVGKNGFHEFSKWNFRPYGDFAYWDLKNNNEIAALPVSPLTEKIQIFYKNMKTNEELHWDITPELWEGNIVAGRISLPALAAALYENDGSNHEVFINYDLLNNNSTLTIKSNVIGYHVYDFPNLKDKIVALKWTVQPANNVQFINYPANLWTHTNAYQYTSYNYDKYNVVSDLPNYQKLSLVFVDRDGESLSFAGNNMNLSGSSKYYYFALPADGVFTEFRLLVSPQYSDTQLRFTIGSAYRAGYPANSAFASRFFNDDYTLKYGCKILLIRAN